jgi:hypothetical protein
MPFDTFVHFAERSPIKAEMIDGVPHIMVGSTLVPTNLEGKPGVKGSLTIARVVRVPQGHCKSAFRKFIRKKTALRHVAQGEQDDFEEILELSKEADGLNKEAENASARKIIKDIEATIARKERQKPKPPEKVQFKASRKEPHPEKLQFKAAKKAPRAVASSKVSKIEEEPFMRFELLDESNDSGVYICNFVKTDTAFLIKTRQGQNGEALKSKEYSFETQAEALEKFERLFKRNTGNKWENRSTFEKKENKYILADWLSDNEDSDVETDVNSEFNPNMTARNVLSLITELSTPTDDDVSFVGSSAGYALPDKASPARPPAADGQSVKLEPFGTLSPSKIMSMSRAELVAEAKGERMKALGINGKSKSDAIRAVLLTISVSD